MNYRYRVEFSHVNENLSDGDVLRHGNGTVEIETDGPVETQAEKDEIARAVGKKINETRTVTKIVIKAIIPLERGEVVIDYADVE